LVQDTLAYLGAILTGLWGVAHIIPTSQVVAGFQPTSRDNRLIIIQEWLAEALTMWGLAILVIVTTAATDNSTNWVYPVAAALLVAIAVLTALTGARTRIVWFKTCPLVLGTAAALLTAARLT
jgi:hypothetical protein